MTACSCSPGACHGGHTINMGMPVVTDTCECLARREFGEGGISECECPPSCPCCSVVAAPLPPDLAAAKARITELETAHTRLVEDVASTVRRFSATLDERDALRARVTELETADREHSQLIEYLHHAHGIDIDREDDDFREWQQRYAEVSDHA